MSLADEISKLENLRRDGVLSEAEFEKAKSKLLDQGGLGDSVQKVISQVDEKTWGLIIHLSQLLGLVFPLVGFIVPIVIWQVMKEKSAALDAHGINITNWLLSLLIYSTIFTILSFIIIGVPLLFVVIILAIVFPIIGAIKAQKGEIWHYPLSIPFLSIPFFKSLFID